MALIENSQSKPHTNNDLYVNNIMRILLQKVEDAKPRKGSFGIQ